MASTTDHKRCNVERGKLAISKAAEMPTAAIQAIVTSSGMMLIDPKYPVFMAAAAIILPPGISNFNTVKFVKFDQYGANQ